VFSGASVSVSTGSNLNGTKIEKEKRLVGNEARRKGNTSSQLTL
jgi:hypothetical protein